MIKVNRVVNHNPYFSNYGNEALQSISFINFRIKVARRTNSRKNGET